MVSIDIINPIRRSVRLLLLVVVAVGVVVRFVDHKKKLKNWVKMIKIEVFHGVRAFSCVCILNY